MPTPLLELYGVRKNKGGDCKETGKAFTLVLSRAKP
jgi:hypothetical protein